MAHDEDFLSILPPILRARFDPYLTKETEITGELLKHMLSQLPKGESFQGIRRHLLERREDANDNFRSIQQLLRLRAKVGKKHPRSRHHRRKKTTTKPLHCYFPVLSGKKQTKKGRPSRRDLPPVLSVSTLVSIFISYIEGHDDLYVLPMQYLGGLCVSVDHTFKCVLSIHTRKRRSSETSATTTTTSPGDTSTTHSSDEPSTVAANSSPEDPSVLPTFVPESSTRKLDIMKQYEGVFVVLNEHNQVCVFRSPNS